MTSTKITASFDYAAMQPDVAGELQSTADTIRRLVRHDRRRARDFAKRVV